MGGSQVPRDEAHRGAELIISTLRVLTFNILHDSVRTSMPPWDARRPLVTDTIRTAHADVACLQEASQRQLENLTADLAEYEAIPGTPSGQTRLPKWALGSERLLKHILGEFFDRGELNPIFIRKGRIRATRHGSLLLSSYREGSGSEWSRSPTPHVVNWARCELSTGGACVIYNTHLGVLPWTATRAARDLLEILDREWNAESQILAGDFNSFYWGPVIRTLLKPRHSGQPAFQDAWSIAARREGGARTFHWGFGWPGPRIDYILLRPDHRVSSAVTSNGPVGQPLPSDHSALIANLELTGFPNTR